MRGLDQRIEAAINLQRGIKHVRPKHVDYWSRKGWHVVAEAVLLNGMTFVYMMPEGVRV